MTNLSNDFHKDLVRDLLFEQGERMPSTWSTQGFGMARIYLDETRDVRLNIWHSALAVPGLTPETGLIHTHPWDFSSRIICGELRNQRYRWFPNEDPVWQDTHDDWCCAEITPGPGGHFIDAQGRATQPSGHSTRRFGNLVPAAHASALHAAEIYTAGMVYAQTFQEIHHTEYVDGTVTINRRHRGDRPDRAFTFWKAERDWVSAEPTDDTTGLVTAIEAALELL